LAYCYPNNFSTSLPVDYHLNYRCGQVLFIPNFSKPDLVKVTFKNSQQGGLGIPPSVRGVTELTKNNLLKSLNNFGQNGFLTELTKTAK